MKKNIMIWIILAIIVVAVVATVLIELDMKSSTTDDPSKQYIHTDPANCTVINFLCVQGKAPFKDEKGCGCKDVQQQYECTAEQRQAEACYELYKPVCGWFDSRKIQCVRYPCASTYSNECFACMDEKVAYWTAGECPK